jgi:hypothetical protein
MMVSLSQLLEESFQIAWDYLERTDKLGDAAAASRFLSDTIEIMIPIVVSATGWLYRIAPSGLISDTKTSGAAVSNRGTRSSA